jgi:hypothetical protein
MRLTREDEGKARVKEPRSGTRRALERFFLAGTAALALSAAPAGCARSFYAVAPERATDLGNEFDTLTPEQLGFVRGGTTLDDAIRTMGGRGMTHVTENTNASSNSAVVSVVGADFQYILHIFRNRRYEQSIRLDLGTAELPQRYALRVAERMGEKIIMALVRDAAGIEPAMMVFIPYSSNSTGSNGTLGRPVYVNMSDLERRHNGMQDPLFVGYDLQAGITFIARDREGVPWETGYLLSWDGRNLGKAPVPFSDLMMCDCVRSWAERQERH